jgi:hypothetical protein
VVFILNTEQGLSMELITARQIVETLARGIHPVTGEAMPPDSPYNQPVVIRALFTVARALDGAAVASAARIPSREFSIVMNVHAVDEDHVKFMIEEIARRGDEARASGEFTYAGMSGSFGFDMLSLTEQQR